MRKLAPRFRLAGMVEDGEFEAGILGRLPVVEVGKVGDDAACGSSGDLRDAGRDGLRNRVDAAERLEKGDGGIQIGLRSAERPCGENTHHKAEGPTPVDVHPTGAVPFGVLQNQVGDDRVSERAENHCADKLSKQIRVHT